MSIAQSTDAGNTSHANGIRLKAAAARTKGDVVRISTGDSDGVYDDATIADDTNVYRVAVADRSMDSGDIADYITEGTVKVTVPSGTYTAGNGLHILDGALADSGAAAEAPSGVSTLNDIGIIKVGGTSVTEITVTLHGFAVTAQT